ncbi:MAG TPA: glycerol kinase GlpK [Verrucomicrobiae bacterium]|nr:glycerol kinase GlpK [Verrucomicrobiae bacterium]
MKHILALDQGTTSSRAIIFNQEGNVVGVAQKEFTQHFPQPGWVEHDPEEIWSSQLEVALNALRSAKLQPSDIAAIGITNQRETTVIWDRATGAPISRAIVWQDRRTASICDRLRKQRVVAGRIQKKTGLVVDPYFSGTKVQWLLDNIRDARKRAEAGELAFGTIDSWLIWKLTGGKAHVTDATNASRTMLFNISTSNWDEGLLKALNVPVALLPAVKSSSEPLGEATGELAGIPITGVAGDQQAALFGQCCFQPGMVKNTYGTGCFMLMNAGKKQPVSRNNLLSTVAWKLGASSEYALEGAVFIAGAVIQWLRDGLGIIRSSKDSETLASQVPDSGGVFLVPAFSGLGAPHWDAYARGAIFGLTRGVTAKHIARAALESIAFQTLEVLHAMQKDSGIKIKELRVDGGASLNNLLMQFQADLIGVPVVRPQTSETTAWGAACLAGLAVGLWKDKKELASLWRAEQRFEPTMPAKKRDALLNDWKRAVERAKKWEQQ